MAELICSNSLGSNRPDRALGLLKNELRRLGSLVIKCADAHAVPAGTALAVDRDAFSAAVTSSIEDHPCITVQREELVSIPEGISTVVATGPLTSEAMSQAIQSLSGKRHLHFYDAMAPIVSVESIDLDIAFRRNRYGKREPASSNMDGGDYINCPMDRAQYDAFVDAVRCAHKTGATTVDAGDGLREFFEACLPIEVLAVRDPMALAYGPMRPVGLRDPRTGRRPFAVVQLRQDNVAGTMYNMVGFQTNLRWGDQERVLRMIPGLERAEFLRLGQIHRNTFISSPQLLRPTLQWHDRENLLFAGQLIGTEGYVGSTASGLLAGLNAARLASGLAPLTLPPTTLMGALVDYVTKADPSGFQPMKANFGLLPGLDSEVRDRQARNESYVARSFAALEEFLSGAGVERSRQALRC